MNRRSFRSLYLVFLAVATAASFSACTVDENAALTTKTAASGSKTKSGSSSVKTEEKKGFAEVMAEKEAERAKRAAEAKKKREKELAAKKKEEEAEARKLAAEKKKEEAEKKALAAKKAREEAAEKKAKEEALAKKKREEEERREARIAARKKAEEAREARREAEELADNAERSSSSGGGGAFFSRLGGAGQYKSKGHAVYVNKMALSGLSPSNAKIEVDLSEQKARVYKTGSGEKQLVIETQVSTGKSGHSTPTGTYRIQEKKVEKRSTLYGSWVSSSGSTVRSSGEAWNPPSGASRFVGAEMPYWMRVNGGIGMHVGYVPDYPASHGCIRVPSAVQPLIYSKVGVGTQVTIRH